MMKNKSNCWPEHLACDHRSYIGRMVTLNGRLATIGILNDGHPQVTPNAPFLNSVPYSWTTIFNICDNHDGVFTRIGQPDVNEDHRPKRFHLTSTPLWYVPGMVRNYKYARTVEDTSFIRIFESAYPDIPREGFDKLAAGDYTLTDEGETVLLTIGE